MLEICKNLECGRCKRLHEFQLFLQKSVTESCTLNPSVSVDIRIKKKKTLIAPTAGNFAYHYQEKIYRKVIKTAG